MKKMNETKQKHDFCTYREAAKRGPLTECTLRRMGKQGLLPLVPVGEKKVLINYGKMLEMLEKQSGNVLEPSLGDTAPETDKSFMYLNEKQLEFIFEQMRRCSFIPKEDSISSISLLAAEHILLRFSKWGCEDEN